MLCDVQSHLWWELTHPKRQSESKANINVLQNLLNLADFTLKLCRQRQRNAPNCTRNCRTIV